MVTKMFAVAYGKSISKIDDHHHDCHQHTQQHLGPKARPLGKFQHQLILLQKSSLGAIGDDVPNSDYEFLSEIPALGVSLTSLVLEFLHARAKTAHRQNDDEGETEQHQHQSPVLDE